MTTKRKANPGIFHSKGQRLTGSIADQIDHLEIGGVIAVAERFSIDGMVDTADLNKSLNRMRSRQSAYVSRVIEELDTREFKIESGLFFNDDKSAVLTVCTITRVS